jgi:hypothetical protein
MYLPDDMLGMDRAEFDEFMLLQATYFTVCVYLGRGAYQTEEFRVKRDKKLGLWPRHGLIIARLYRDKILRDCPPPKLMTKPMIYGVIEKDGKAQLSIFVE